ncbi:MAG TPA: hypothetical protein VN673_18060, partial [Clostridia bacterium]|nr:hypothetical protein [Clostridia bacterium]
RLLAPSCSGDGVFRMSLAGESGVAYEIFASTNLVSWDLAGTVTNVSGTVEFSQPALGTARKFYRVRTGP